MIFQDAQNSPHSEKRAKLERIWNATFFTSVKSGYYQVVTGKSETLNLEGNRTARERFRLWVTGREYPELTLPFNAVRCEVCMINSKNYGKKFTLRKIHQRAIGKIHGAIPIARHQTVHMLQFRIFDCTEDQCSGTDEPPGGLHLRARFANEVEQFVENSL